MTRTIYRGAEATYCSPARPKSEGGRAIDASITLATNNGDIGGGEVMLLRLAQALRQLGRSVTVVAPATPSGLGAAARDAGLDTVTLAASDRRGWMRALRRWDRRERSGLLWCNGLVPALATAGHPDRVVHLHQRPRGAQRPLAPIARRGALVTVVPSEFMRGAIRGATVLPNWTDPIPEREPARQCGGPIVVGFLGRLSPDKGVIVLARAMRILERRRPGQLRLLVAGEPRFVRSADYAKVDVALGRIADVSSRVGWMDRDEFFSRIDILAMPSMWGEPFGLGAAEAMAARVPVVVSDDGALPEVVGPGGIVVPAGDARALANALQNMAESDQSSYIEKMYERWRENFSPEAGMRSLALLLAGLDAGGESA